jgi:hypothetical protein
MILPPRARRGRRSRPRRTGSASRLAALLAAVVVGCASGPPPPDWQASATGAMDAALSAYLAGDTRTQALQFDLARREIARTGRPSLLARAELMMCSAAVASLVFEPCAGFERLKADAQAQEAAYARYLAAHPLAREDIERLPAAQRPSAAAVASGEAATGSIAAIEDPLSRLIAIAVLFEAGRASPQMIALATDTASAQGWRRPLLAWLGVQVRRAETAGDAEEAQRLRRRVEVVLGVR